MRSLAWIIDRRRSPIENHGFVDGTSLWMSRLKLAKDWALRISIGSEFQSTVADGKNDRLKVSVLVLNIVRLLVFLRAYRVLVFTTGDRMSERNGGVRLFTIL